MKRVPIVVLLGLAAATGIPARVTASSPPPPPRKPITVVATYFSNLSPKVGQHETVTAQFYLYQPKKKPQYLAGGHLSVTLKVGTVKVAKSVVATLKGTSTNKRGKAYARFTVPKSAAGKWLWAYTTVRYKGAAYGGSNRVKIAK
jgi:hypothetical protein